MEKRATPKAHRHPPGTRLKRPPNLYSRICAFLNLCDAARQAQRIKRYEQDARAFSIDFEQNVLSLGSELKEKTYRPGPYKTFVIREPKPTTISAESYRDWVVHHALYNVIERVFDHTFIDTCFAYRRGKGSRRALDWFTRQARVYRYCLHVDIADYLPSIDLDLLKERIRRTLKCKDTLWLTDLILDHTKEQEPKEQHPQDDDLVSPKDRQRGLPAGSLTSRLWVNVYLNGIDHLMARTFDASRYGRYMHEIVLFSADAAELERARERLAKSLETLGLSVDPARTAVIDLRQD